MRRETDLIALVKRLSENSPFDDIRKAASGIMYTLNEFPKKVSEAKAKTNVVKSSGSTKNHVMISYNWKSRDICIQIKERLKNRGLKVWIDIEQIQGSAVQSMAEAVENASVFLMCMTENYYQSPNCRLGKSLILY